MSFMGGFSSGAGNRRSYNRAVNSRSSASVASAPGAAAPPGANPVTALAAVVAAEIAAAGGWLGFERFMELALYAPGLGYYARGSRQFGPLPGPGAGTGPGTGSDFITAPEMSPLFGAALARQVAQALQASGTTQVWEFGAGSGALAAQLLQALGDQVQSYSIIDLSGPLRERQRATIAARAGAHLPKVQWLGALPPRMQGVVVGNEVLDAMPVLLLHYDGRLWWERGVALEGGRLTWRDAATSLQPPVQAAFVPGTVTELGRHAAGFLRTLAGHLERGAAFFIDYGFPQAEYYHPQRTGGTLMCHRAHRVDADPLEDVGDKDITAHVDFTAMALAGQDAGLVVLGYTTQAHFLINCGLLDLLQGADLRTTSQAHRLLAEHEMGELFKVIGFAAGSDAWDALGFAAGDRTHTL
jgi:SAM-dependent MidA family methyltransferase